ncbi:MAG: aspartate kinase [Clostridiales bacterium]|nr:aspartate kinase [Clostridiales bacterium]MCF8023238.1 aspartate kinase [Clostridiales bacterium]
MLVVQKYGGSSVANSERIRRVARRVVDRYREGCKMIVVVSAMGDTTDNLIDMARDISNSPSKREMDMLISTGEQMSIALLAMAVRSLGENAVSLTGPQVSINTDDNHCNAKIRHMNTGRLESELNRGNIVVVAGFQGINQLNDVTTLGRGGSDTTAVALAAAVKADTCEIYTDVDGVYTTDPRVEVKARKLDCITYDEMLELANLGASVLHPRAVEYAKLHNIPVHVRSSFNYNKGTIVKEVNDMEMDLVVTGVTYDLNTAKIGIFDVPDKPGTAYRIFDALAEAKINVDMIIQSAMRNQVNNIAFTVTHDDLSKALNVVESIQNEVGFKGYTHDESVAKISIVGAGMASNPGVASTMFEAMMRESINLEMITTSDIKVSCIIKEDLTQIAVKSLHKFFNLEFKDNHAGVINE